jgi:hypothetical protein
MRAAIAALPHEVPRLAVTAQITDNDIATILDRRLKRIEETKLIEATNGAKVIGPSPNKSKPSLPSLARMIAGFAVSSAMRRWFDRRCCAILCGATGTYREVPVGESGAPCIQCLGAPLAQTAVAGLIFGGGYSRA